MSHKNKRSQKLYDTLMNSSDTIEKFEKIIEECSAKNKKYKDPEFYPQIKLSRADREIIKNNPWCRIENDYPSNLFENISPESIKQGSLGNCYFIVSLIYMAHYKDRVKSLFHPKSSLKYGCVLVYFYYLGERIPIIIDTQVPYQDSNSQLPLFSRPRSFADSCWFVLVEKAYAKACGDYSSIISGNSHFSTHLLSDFFSLTFSKIVDIIPSKSLQEEEFKQTSNYANDDVFRILTDLKEKNAMLSTSINKEESEEFDESIGLIPNHAYLILDVRESEETDAGVSKMRHYIKLRNPWGIGVYRGSYNPNSDKWTEQLKKDLSYSKVDDGSFWMLLENYFYYFNRISYSLPKENYWKEMSVYGEIEGYLDGRSPCSDSPSVGCIPQWSIKFSQKTIVRLTFDVAGPESFHGLYICKNHGHKVNKLSKTTEMMRSVTNSFVNGIEYVVDDFSEPLTFFLTREEARNEPCYFRILIQSPDASFVVTKFNDNFIKENWNSFTDSRFFSPIDYWDPINSPPLTTCRQWFIRFPNLIKNNEGELRFRIFKNVNEGPLYLLIARTSEKISYCYKCIQSIQYDICTVSDYEEISVPISFKNFYKSDDIFVYKEIDSIDYVFAFYRTKESNINSFKFTVLCESEFQIGLMPEPDPANNIGYKIEVSDNLDENEESSSIYNKFEHTDKWMLVFKKDVTTLYVEFICDNPSFIHKISLIEKEDNLKNMGFKNSEFHFNIDQNCPRNQAIWKIERNYNPFELFVTSDISEEKCDYTLNLFGTNDFKVFKIDKNGNEIPVPKIDKLNITSTNIQNNYFPEVVFIKQPNNFHPIKKEKSNSSQIITNNQIDDNSIYYYEYDSGYNQEEEEQFEQYQESGNDLRSQKFNIQQHYDNNNDDIPQKRKVQKNINKDDFVVNQNIQMKTNSQTDYSYYNEYYSTNVTGPKTDQYSEYKTISNETNENQANKKNNFNEVSNDTYNNESISYTVETNVVSYNKNETERIIDEAKCYLYQNDIQYFDISLISASRQKLIYVLIGFEILILKRKIFSRKIANMYHIYFNNISKISFLQENNIIEIQFSKHSMRKAIMFHSDKSKELLNELIIQIFRTLTKSEISRITFDNINMPETLPDITSRSISLRLNSKASFKRFQIHNDYLKIFAKTLFSHSNSFFFAKVKKMKKLFPFLFPCVSLDKEIEQIDVVDPKNIFPLMLKYIEYFQNIKHLKIKGNDSIDIQNITNKIINIYSISFHDFQVKKFHYLTGLINAYRVNSIGFDSALNEDSFKTFIEHPSFINLEYFRVSNFTKINFKSCAPHFKYLSVLSLPYCRLEIGNVLQEIKTNQLTFLKLLDLSGNKAIDPNYLNYSIPNELRTLHVNDVQWELNNLNYFIDTCSNSKLMSLSIDKVDFIDTVKAQDKWNMLFSNLPNRMKTLHFFSWNSNEVNHNFITFVIDSTHLSEASFCFCNCTKLNDIKRLLTQDQRMSKINLQQISFVKKEIYLEHFKSFLRDIPQMRSLKQIDLSHNYFDDECLEILSNSLVNSNVDFISIDNSNFDSFSDLMKFYKSLRTKREMPINISYPINDIQRLNLNGNEILLLDQCLNKLKYPLDERDSISIDSLQEVSFLKISNPFPQFLPLEIKRSQAKKVLTQNDLNAIKRIGEKELNDESVSTYNEEKANLKQQQLNANGNSNNKNNINNGNDENNNNNNNNTYDYSNINTNYDSANENNNNNTYEYTNENNNNNTYEYTNENNNNNTYEYTNENNNNNTYEYTNENNNNNTYEYTNENNNNNDIISNNKDDFVKNANDSEGSYYYYYTDSEISEVDQTQSQIKSTSKNIQNNKDFNNQKSSNINRSSNSNKSGSYSKNSVSINEKPENVPNKKDSQKFQQDESFNHNPYYQYVNKLSADNEIRYNRNIKKPAETSHLHNTILNRSMFKRNQLSLIHLSSSYSDISDNDSQDDIFHIIA